MQNSGAYLKAHFEENLSSSITATDIGHDDFHSFIHSHTPDGATGLAWLLRFEHAKAQIFKGYLSLTTQYGGFLECRGLKFELVKTKFNAENFICRLSWSISTDLA